VELNAAGRGVGLIAVGLHRVGHDLRLIQQGDERFL